MVYRVRKRQIRKALENGGKIDASAMVLRGSGKPVFSNKTAGAHLPPFYGPAYQLDPEFEDHADWNPRGFERLSLAARAKLALIKAPASASEAECDAVHRSVGELKLHLDNFPVVYAEDILESLAMVADELGPDQGRNGQVKTAEQLAMRGGLQLVGCHIRARQSADGIRLVNARQPISLRFIGCVIECPLFLAHCHLVTLDLSGSALAVFDATGLIASGSVHMRRAFMRTGVSFAGARIAGSMNFSDCVIAPLDRQPAQLPLNRDHGLFNMSQVNVDGEMRFTRARIWGGLSVRGAVIGRSLTLTSALIVCPLGLLEKKLHGAVAPQQAADESFSFASSVGWGERLCNADWLRSRRLHGLNEKPFAHDRQALSNLEVLPGPGGEMESVVDDFLQKVTLRTVLTAVRADGVRVSGSVFSRAMSCNGRFRMKYSHVDGAVRFEGSLIRSPADIRHQLTTATWETLGARGDALRAEFQRWAKHTLVDRDWFRESPSTALDLRDSHLTGDLSLGWPQLIPTTEQVRGFERKCRSRMQGTDMIGDLQLEGLRTSGSLVLYGLRCHRRPPAQAAPDPAPAQAPSFGSLWRAARRALFETRSAGKPAIDRDPRRNRFDVQDRLFDIVSIVASLPKGGRGTLEKSDRLRDALQHASSDYDLHLKQVHVGRDVDLRAIENVRGVDLESAEIGGDLRFSDKSSGRAADDGTPQGFILCRGRPLNLQGEVNLRAATIEGDAFLVFDARRGPNLKAGMLSVAGRLDIYPQEGAINYQVTIDPEKRPLETDPVWKAAGRTRKPGFWLEFCEHEERTPRPPGAPPGRYCGRCHAMLDKVEDHLAWFIDLRNARAAVFSHPPAAWPDPGGLSLDGFAYQQTSDLGPLAPKPPLVENRYDNHERGRLRYAWRAWPLRRALIGVCAILVGGAAVAGGAWLLWSLTWPDAITMDGLALARIGGFAVLAAAIRFIFGRALNWRLAGIVALVLAFGIGWPAVRGAAVYAPGLSFVVALLISWWACARILLAVPPGEPVWVPFKLHYQDDIAPRAIEYLARQRMSESRFKWRPSGYTVLDSYARAARALREAGRYVSANRVEEERLRKRTQMLSWRHHGAIKLMLNAVDSFCGYGFQLSRAVGLLCAIVCLVAAGAHWAAARGYLVTKQPEVAATGRGWAAGGKAGPQVYLSGVCGSSDGGALRQDCPDLVYAADLLLPFISLQEENRWRAAIPPRAVAPLSRIAEPWQSLWVSFLRSWPALVNALGLLLTAIMAVAVAQRAESAFSRVEE